MLFDYNLLYLIIKMFHFIYIYKKKKKKKKKKSTYKALVIFNYNLIITV